MPVSSPSPIPSFTKLARFTGSSFKIASRRQWSGGGGGGSGGRRGEVPGSACFARRFFAPLPYQKTWSQASTKRKRPAISLDCTEKPTDAIHYSLTTLDYSATTTALLGVVWGVHSVIQAVHPETSVFIFPLILHFRYWHSS